MIDVNERLREATQRYHEANAEIVHASIYLLCTLARDEFPDAKTLEFEWSDQGSFLSLMSYDEGQPVDDLDDECLSWNLGDDNESVWGHYMSGYGPRQDRFALAIDDALARSMAALTGEATEPEPAPDAPAPENKDPDTVERFLNS